MTALCILLMASATAAAQPGPDHVALVSDVRGVVRVAVGAKPAAPLSRLAWLEEGARVTAAQGASAIVVFWSGKRWRVESGSAGRITDDGVARISGTVTALESFPPLPHVARLSSRSSPGSSYGAVRLRGGAWTVIYPREDIRTRASDTTLFFEGGKSGGSYEIEIVDGNGTSVFKTTTPDARLRVPASTLKPGARYSWIARPSAPGMAAALGEFTTIDERAEAERAALRAAGPVDDAASLAMLAELDAKMGLLAEARAGFEAALALAPQDPMLRARVEALAKAGVPLSAPRAP